MRYEAFRRVPASSLTMDTLFSPVAHDALYPLPLACALDVFARLSCGERLFCMAVSKPWRAALSRGSLWRDVDLSTTSGEAVVNDGLLRCLSRVSRGHLRSLDVADRLHFDAAPLLGDIELTGKHTVSWDTLVLVVASQAATLRRLCLLRCVDMIVPGRLEALLESAPLLEHVEVDVACTPDNAHPLLLREHPFEALRMRTLRLGAEEGVESDAVSIEALSRGIEAHSGLLELTILRTPLQHGHVFSALAAASLHIVDLILSRCNLNSSSISGLVHLVDKGTLSKLFIFNDDIALFHEAEARAFAKAVCDNRTLTSLSLHRVCLWVREMHLMGFVSSVGYLSNTGSNACPPGYSCHRPGRGRSAGGSPNSKHLELGCECGGRRTPTCCWQNAWPACVG